VAFMNAALGGRPPAPFPPPPEGIVFLDIDADTGLLARPGCPKTRTEAFVAGTEPRQPCGAH
jgi:membrane carboxypeptidase/penicillin-binding protein